MSSDKQTAHKIQSIFKDLNHEIPLGHCYEFMAKMEGVESWNMATARRKAINQELLSALKEAIQDCRCTVGERMSGHHVDCRAPGWIDLVQKLDPIETCTFPGGPTFSILENNELDQYLLIKDEDHGPSVTNRAEQVVAYLMKKGVLPVGKKLFYIDTMERQDEILRNEQGHFAGFNIIKNHYLVHVKVKQLVKHEELDFDDQEENPVGEYTFEVIASSEKKAEELALDYFHRNIPIACLDDFEIDTEVSQDFSHWVTYLPDVIEENRSE